MGNQHTAPRDALSFFSFHLAHHTVLCLYGDGGDDDHWNVTVPFHLFHHRDDGDDDRENHDGIIYYHLDYDYGFYYDFCYDYGFYCEYDYGFDHRRHVFHCRHLLGRHFCHVDDRMAENATFHHVHCQDDDVVRVIVFQNERNGLFHHTFLHHGAGDDYHHHRDDEDGADRDGDDDTDDNLAQRRHGHDGQCDRGLSTEL
mmetsp:Transcript_40397/g.60581  ORF Transcript_40397/g.60581 Transcript_40397/m.60581 type:complete len:200 (-) Transcript_40397:205-804(-)